jgi:hypothetical protein
MPDWTPDWMPEWMAEWWTYQPGDLLMFSPRIYWRLFESINDAFWPAPWMLPVLGLLGLVVLQRAQRRAGWTRATAPTTSLRAAAAMLAAAWAVVAWAFLWQRFAPIQPVAAGFALAFGVQAAGLLALGAAGTLDIAANPSRRRTGVALAAWALVGHPLLAWVQGRPWTQAEVAGLAPDPTVLATLGCLLLIRPHGVADTWGWRALWVVPLAWCAVSAATLWTLGSAQGWVVGAGAAAALAAAYRGRNIRKRCAGVISK